MSVVFQNNCRCRHTLDLATMRTVQRILNVTGSWPSEAFGEKKRPLTYIIQCLNAAYAVSYLTCLVNYYNQPIAIDVIDVSQSGIAGMLATIHMLRIIKTLMPSYGKDMKDFVEIFHLYYIKDVDERHTQIYNYVEKFTKLVTGWQLFVCFSMPITMVSSCFILNLSKGFYSGTALNGTEPAKLVAWKIPGVELPETSFYHYFYDLSYVFFSGFSVLSIPTVLSVMVFHMIGHIFLIIHKLERLCDDRDNSVMVYDHEDNKAMKDKLSDIVQHHCTILRFRDLISSFGEMAIVTNYCYQLICGCMLMFVLTSPLNYDVGTKTEAQSSLIELWSILDAAADPGSNRNHSGGEVCGNIPEKLKAIIISLSTLVDLLSQSFLFEMIGTVGDRMSLALYQCPWEKANVSNRRSIVLMLMMLQRPLQIKGLHIVVFGFQTMVVIVKSSFSYFILLRSLD